MIYNSIVNMRRLHMKRAKEGPHPNHETLDPDLIRIGRPIPVLKPATLEEIYQAFNSRPKPQLETTDD